MCGKEEMLRVLDHSQILLDSTQDEDYRIQIFSSVGKLLKDIGTSHPLFQGLVEKSKMHAKSKYIDQRKRSLAAFRVLGLAIPQNDLTWFCMLYLSDSDLDVRLQATKTFAEIGLFNDLKNFTTLISEDDVKS